MLTNTSPGISQRTNVYAATEMLIHAMSIEVTSMYAMVASMPKNSSNTMRFRRLVPLKALTAPLTEGITPPPTAFRYEDVDVVMQQWGEWIPVTDVIEDLHEDPVLNNISELLGENVGRTREAVNWNVLRGGTSVAYSNGVSRSAVITPITRQMQRRIVSQLRRNKAMMISKVLNGSVYIETSPIEAAYVALCHSDCETAIRNMDGFVPTSKYARGPIMPHEIGSVESVRYIISPDLEPYLNAGAAITVTNGQPNVYSAAGVNANVYPIVYMGMEAWGCVPLRMGTGITGKGQMPPVQPHMESPKPQGSDPLGQRGFASVKYWHSALRLNETWMIRAEVAAEY